MKKIELNKKPIYVPAEEHKNADIYDIFLQIEQACENCFFLESLGEQAHLSRYSIVGFNPTGVVSSNGTQVMLDGTSYTVDNPYTALRDLIPQDSIGRNYAGGLVGYLGYDAMSLFEPTLDIKKHPYFPTYLFGMYTDGIIYDKVTGELIYFYYNENRVKLLEKLLKTPVTKKYVSIKNLNQTTSEKEHAAMVEAVKQEILAGNTFQTVVGIQNEFEITGDAIELYARLRKVNPSPFMYYVKFGPSTSLGSSTVLIGASPELLFGMRDKEMQTFPLAGTIKRGKTEQEDRELAHNLLTNKKEIAEHSMLVDLHRNDLGRVAQFGSVKVRSLMDIKRFSHVQHISSEVVGLLERKQDMFSALASVFPAGTLTGAPKIEAMKIIDRLEKAPRGPYGGAVGHFGFNGDATFAIPIRTIFINGTYGFTQAGSGIVADSTAKGEYDEIQRKMAAMKEVLM